MNIAQAKEEIINTVKAYTAKKENGKYKIPAIHQRPVLLIGPPGIGKTAIIKQIAQEQRIGLVEYTLTHHTRQSAVGLPILEKKVFAGKEFTVTEYTMSEIVASVYECMENQKVKEGILFLDEINCVSETLAPTMLQFLQCKTFGTHKLPEGWVIVAAGNPAKYNRSVRDFDVVTLDRVKKIEIQEDYPIWKLYARKEKLHSSILAYLDLKKENFYRIQEEKEGTCFVTARGWEDLSRIIQVYEELDIPVTKDVVYEYLQHQETAGDFAGFYQLCRKYEEDYAIRELFSLKNQENLEEKAKLLGKSGFDEKLTVMNLLEAALHGMVQEYFAKKTCISGLYQEMKMVKMQAEDARQTQDFIKLMEEFLKQRKEKERILTEQRIFSASNAESEQEITRWLGEKVQELKEQRLRGVQEGYCWIKEEFYRETLQLKKMEQQTRQALDYGISLMKKTCEKGQELSLFLSRISGNEEIMTFISRYGSDEYLKEGESLLIHEKEAELKREVQAFQEKSPEVLKKS